MKILNPLEILIGGNNIIISHSATADRTINLPDSDGVISLEGHIHTGDQVTINTDNFNRILSNLDNDVQKSLDTIDNIVAGINLSNIFSEQQEIKTSNFQLKLSYDSSYHNYVYTLNDGSMKIGNGTDRILFLGNTGNLGIGTENPTERLYVKLDQNNTTALMLENLNAGATAGSAVFVKSDNTYGGLVSLGSGVSTTSFEAISGTRVGLSTGAAATSTGIGIAARTSGGDIRLYTGGVANTNRRVTIYDRSNAPIVQLYDSRNITWSGKEESGTLEWYTADASTPGGSGLSAGIGLLNSSNNLTVPTFDIIHYSYPVIGGVRTPTEVLRISNSGKAIIGFSDPNPTIGMALTTNSNVTWFPYSESIVGTQETYNPSSLGSEILANTDFTSGSPSWTKVGCTLSESLNVATLTETSAAITTARATQTVTVIPGARYRATVNYISSTSTGITEAHLRIGTSAGLAQLGYIRYITPSSDKTFTADFVIPDGVTTLYFSLYHTSDASTIGISSWTLPSLKLINGGNIIARGKFTGGGSLGLSIDASGNAIFDGTLKTSGIKKNVVTKTGNYTATTSDEEIVFTSAPFTLTLPTTPSIGTSYRISNESSSGTITIDGAGTDTIKGELTQELNPGDDLIITYYDVGKWV